MNDFFEIPPVPIAINTEGGDVVTIQPPGSWVGLKPVNVHLLSYQLRDGQVRRFKVIVKQHFLTIFLLHWKDQLTS